jgi:hypothetical protein
MNFTKTLLAVAIAGTSLMASVSAEATVLGANDAFLQVWDQTNKQTYDLNLAAVAGFTDTSLLTSGTVSIDLTKDAVWNAFAATLDTANTVWGVVATSTQTATSGQFEITTNNDATVKPYATIGGYVASENAIVGQISRIDQSLTPSINGVVVADGSSNLGGFQQDPTAPTNTLSNLWGTAPGTSAGIAFGTVANFESIAGSNVKTGLSNKFTETNTLPGTFTLTGTTLTFTSATVVTPPPATVPLPAAVWMFGAGLMGFFGLNRRKAAV